MNKYRSQIQREAYMGGGHQTQIVVRWSYRQIE